jgi:hypothetical protein
MSRCDVSWITTIDVARPCGIKYSFTLHDVDGCWGTTTRTVYRVRKSTIIDIAFGTPESWCLMSFLGADELLVDFFAAVERACSEEGSAFEFETEEIELEGEEDDDAQAHD